MTEIDVPDWVVEVASDAYLRSRGVYRGEIPFDYDDMRAALTAALGAWVVPAGYRALGKPRSEGAQYIAYTHNPDTATTYMLYGMMVEPIYTLRQEKPE